MPIFCLKTYAARYMVVRRDPFKKLFWLLKPLVFHCMAVRICKFKIQFLKSYVFFGMFIGNHYDNGEDCLQNEHTLLMYVFPK